MTWLPYLFSFGAGLGVGALYALLTVRSPAPPIIALLGLLGMLAGEAAVSHLLASSEVKNAAAAQSVMTTKTPRGHAFPLPHSASI